jgi:hypothetical protein
MERPQDFSFEALVEVTGATVSSERGALNAALRDIREAADELTDEELASEIRYRASIYRAMWPDMALTPTALSKHWERIPLEAPKPTYPEPSPAAECETCGGNKFVVYSTRPSANPLSLYEEVAPCPDCNSGANAGFWRSDGTRFNAPDPGLVRRRIG